MKSIIFLHSSTGNTRVVARFAAAQLKRLGHDCSLVDITHHPEPPNLDDVDLIGLACPSMYWRPTVVMERFIARMPETRSRPKPAFQLATASGDPGSHFALAAEQLAPKGWITLRAYFVPMVNNWPSHRALSERVPFAGPVAEIITEARPFLRSSLGWLWPDVGEPLLRHRDGLVAFMEDVARRAEARDFSAAKAPRDLWRGSRWMAAVGRVMTVKQMRQATGIQVDASRCTRCGTCVQVCPVDCMTRAKDDEVPHMGAGCTGCWACFNHCVDGALSGMGAPLGAGRYTGPSAQSRALFRPK
jgi:Pyruvate/2-oxoacid:ferredoxin oxidoreductase delta subunit